MRTILAAIIVIGLSLKLVQAETLKNISIETRAGVTVSALLTSTRSPKAALDFWDPWGNHFQIVDYREIQFERTDGVKQKLGVSGLEKGEQARRELAARDLGES